ncbi:MAG: hypothetical protein HUU15_15285, partial [Candidatus Brocadiae bacterium]|nr:hypothetical protein [Candidatus Brocadiia bacterium]
MRILPFVLAALLPLSALAGDLEPLVRDLGAGDAARRETAVERLRGEGEAGEAAV